MDQRLTFNCKVPKMQSGCQGNGGGSADHTDGHTETDYLRHTFTIDVISDVFAAQDYIDLKGVTSRIGPTGGWRFWK